MLLIYWRVVDPGRIDVFRIQTPCTIILPALTVVKRKILGHVLQNQKYQNTSSNRWENYGGNVSSESLTFPDLRI